MPRDRIEGQRWGDRIER